MFTQKVQNNNLQKSIDDLFDKNATYWRDTYKESDLNGIIYQRRQAAALGYIDGLSLPRTVNVLEVGCGAGFMTAALANRGFAVEAIDHSQTMIDLTLELVRLRGIGNLINATVGDAHKLSYRDQSFDLIVALGVMPWLHDFKKALCEIVRVLRPYGYVILTMDNVLRATTLLDPFTFPAITNIRRWGRHKLERAGLITYWGSWINAPPYRQHSIKEFNQALRVAGLNVLKSKSIGFGPFTFFSYRLFPDRIGIKIQLKLQEYADSGYPILRSTGSQYLVLSQKRR